MRESCPEARFYQASSSEMFGKVRETPQTEATPFYPRSPYGVAKAYGHHITVNYRESLRPVRHAPASCSTTRARAAGSSSSPARSPGTPRRSSSGWRTSCGSATSTRERDWGYAEDYVEAMWLMLQQDDAGRLRHRHRRDAHACADAWRLAFERVGLDWERYVVIDDDAQAPGRGGPLVGDAGKAKRVLGWEPRTSFEELIGLMVDADLELLSG